MASRARSVSERRERRLLIVLGLNVMIVAGEAAAGFLADSIGLLADAGHNLVDVGGIALALLAVRWSRRTPDASRSFGYHRSSVLAAQANAAAILITTAVITYESVRRLIHPEAVEGRTVIAVAATALVVNGFSALLLREKEHDINMRGAVLHMAADAAASFGVVVSGIVVLVVDGAERIDPLISLLIAALISWQAWLLLRSTGDVLLESTPRGLDVAEVAATIMAVVGVEAVHDLHVWSLSSEVRALSAHVIVEGHPSLEDAQQVATRVKAAISAPFSIAHATIELECEGCVDNGAWCAIEGLDVHVTGGHAGHDH